MPWANYPPKLKLLGKGTVMSDSITSLTVGLSNLYPLKNGPNFHLESYCRLIYYIYC